MPHAAIAADATISYTLLRRVFATIYAATYAFDVADASSRHVMVQRCSGHVISHYRLSKFFADAAD